MVTFKKYKIDLGEVKTEIKIPFDFPFEGDSNCIEYVTGSCGCTKTQILKNSIVGVYSTGAKEGPIVRSVTVYYKDGLPLYAPKNENGVQLHNADKARTILRLSGSKKNA